MSNKLLIREIERLCIDSHSLYYERYLGILYAFRCDYNWFENPDLNERLQNIYNAIKGDIEC